MTTVYADRGTPILATAVRGERARTASNGRKHIGWTWMTPTRFSRSTSPTEAVLREGVPPRPRMTAGGIPMPPFYLSDLNRETTARYEACRAAGTHRPGPRLTVPRPVDGGEGAPAHVCDTCGVPIIGAVAGAAVVRRTVARRRAGKVTATAWAGDAADD
jgi:hypothetical protein